MTRIGFAYNQKPETGLLRLEDDADAPRPDEEPPSKRRDDWSRSLESPALATAGAAPSATESVDDEFAEWDSEETIAAVELALSALGEVIRLEANAEFPERLRATAPRCA